jgi:hypothetical protein
VSLAATASIFRVGLCISYMMAQQKEIACFQRV